MFELFLNDRGGDGTLAEVWIDKDAKLCKKFYKQNSITIKGRPPIPQVYKNVKNMYITEVYWAEKLKSDFVVEMYDHGELPNDQGFYILQEYIGPDLLMQHNTLQNNDLYSLYPDFDDQLVEMFAFFKQKNIYKFNNALANITGSNGKIKAFDFKYALSRKAEHRDFEVSSVETWISSVLGNTELTNKVSANI